MSVPVLDWLAEQSRGIEVRFPPGMPDHIQRLMGTLGIRVIFDPTIDTPYRKPRARAREDAQARKGTGSSGV